MNQKNQSKSHLLEASILPTWLNQRTIGTITYLWMWIAMCVIISTFQIGQMGVGGGLSVAQTAMIVLLANLSLAIVMCLTADIGTEHGISFAVYLRAIFGIYGTHLPSVTRGIVAAAWFGIQTYLGALALNGIIKYFTGFDNWTIWYIIFGIVQITNTAMGIRAVQKFADFAAPVVMAISVWMYFRFADLPIDGSTDHNIWTFVKSVEEGNRVSFFTLFMSMVAWWSALAIDIPNLTRFVKTKGGEKSFFKRNKHIFVAQFLGLSLTQTLMAVIGGIAFLTTGDWNPITIIQDTSGGFVLVVMLVMIVLAQWSTNSTANLIPAALTFVNAGAPKISYAWGIILAGIIGTAVMPWKILSDLFVFLGLYGAALSAVGGIMICDYYILRKRCLNVPDLYEYQGQFRYSGGVNLAGLFSWIISGGLALYFFDYAYLIGLPLGFVTYYILMKGWYLKQYPQAEIDNPDDEKYLATTVNKNWVYLEEKGIQRFQTSDIPLDVVDREDL